MMIWILPPLSNSWILFILYLYTALDVGPILDCYSVGANLNPSPYYPFTYVHIYIYIYIGAYIDIHTSTPRIVPMYFIRMEFLIFLILSLQELPIFPL